MNHAEGSGEEVAKLKQPGEDLGAVLFQTADPLTPRAGAGPGCCRHAAPSREPTEGRSYLIVLYIISR
jgi:hypothetical protein